MGSPPEPHDKISYVTDIEGNWEFFVRFIDLSEALSLIALPAHGSPAAQVDLQDGWQLVVGGDCCDKGGAVGGSIRVVSTLVELKRRYPTRVTLILGNRDGAAPARCPDRLVRRSHLPAASAAHRLSLPLPLPLRPSPALSPARVWPPLGLQHCPPPPPPPPTVNKMRMTSELSEGQLAHERLSTTPGPYWVPESKRVAPCAFLRATAAQRLGAGLAGVRPFFLARRASCSGAAAGPRGPRRVALCRGARLGVQHAAQPAPLDAQGDDGRRRRV